MCIKLKGGFFMTKQGALYFDPIYDRFNIRFDLDEYYSGLHCGDCFDVLVHGKWKATRIEMYEDWYLVNVKTANLNGLRVRITV